jgi:acyl-CoA-binding protein
MTLPDPRDGIPQFVAECRDRIDVLTAMFPLFTQAERGAAIDEMNGVRREMNESQRLWDEWQLLKGSR